jgi:hypothetical protein
MARFARWLGIAGIVLLGAALALAPIAAFQDRMIVVTALGIAGVALLLGARALRPRMPEPEAEAVEAPEAPRDGSPRR